MRRLILPVLIALVACGPTAPEPTDAPMTSIVGFDPARFAGSWHEVAAIGRPAGGRWQVAARPDGAFAVASERDGTGQGRMTGPGRIALSTFDAPLWVLWADADMRTIVIGTPDRSFAMILDRAAGIPADRLKAAREILAWNGYDLGALG